MNFLRSASFLVALLILCGCYEAHGDDDPRALPGDAGPLARVDAARGPGPGPSDASIPEPPEPDPDLGPDAPPSEYPDAMEWEAPPPRAPDEPCCVLGEPRRVTSRSDGVALAHESPVVVWGPSVWGLFATRLVELPGETITMPTFFQVGADGAPLGPPQDVGGIGLRRATAAWAEGRWALMYAAGSLEHGHVFTVSVQLFDRALRPVAPMVAASGAGDHDAIALARLTSGNRWYAVNTTREGESINVTGLDELGNTESRVWIDTPPRHQLRAVGMRSRVAIISALFSGEVVAHTLGPRPEHRVSGPLDLGLRGRAIALAAVGDRATAVAMDESGQVSARVFDPFALAPIDAAPVEIARVSSPERQSIDAAGSSKFGLTGVCVAHTGSDGLSRVELLTLDTEGRLYGAAVEIVETRFRGSLANCTVGSDGRGFLVAWWNGSELWVRRVDIPER